MDYLAHLPWYVKLALSLGAGTMAWKFVQNHVATIFEWLTPLVLGVVDKVMALAFIHPIVRWFVFGNKANVETMLTALCDGLERLVDAIEKRMIADIEVEAAKDACPTPPPPASSSPPAAP